MSPHMTENRKANILVVDDNPQNLKVVGSMLKDKGYQLSIALSGEDSIKYLEKNRADLILLDIMMPGMDGFEVCERIKANANTKDIPIIFLTARNELETITKGFESGAVDFVTKPFNAAELMARINTHLELNFKKQEVLTINAKLQQTMEKLKEAAETDPLTNLLNRRSISTILKDETARMKRSRKAFSVMMADIDHFKRFNDQYGHDCGDFVLRSVSTIFDDSIREQDKVARWGGRGVSFSTPGNRFGWSPAAG